MGCYVCGNCNTENHHIIFRGQSKALIKCKLNLVELCEAHHRGHDGIHGKNGRALDLKLKLDLQDRLFSLFEKDYITKKDIENKLEISLSCVEKVVKGMVISKEGYEKEAVIRKLLGGKLYV